MTQAFGQDRPVADNGTACVAALGIAGPYDRVIGAETTAIHQRFRTQVRAESWQKVFLTKPLEVRRDEVEAMRAASEKAKQAKPIEIMDVAENAVLDLLRRFDWPNLIHGHTHRRACHELEWNGYHTQRWVLPDWYETGGYLKAASEGDWQFFESTSLHDEARPARKSSF